MCRSVSSTYFSCTEEELGEEEVELGDFSWLDGFYIMPAVGSRERSTTLIQTESSQQLLDGLPLTLVELSMVP